MEQRPLYGAHEECAAQVRSRPEAGVGQVHLILVGFDVGDQRFEIIRREVLLSNERHRLFVDETDGLKIFDRIVREFTV